MFKWMFNVVSVHYSTLQHEMGMETLVCWRWHFLWKIARKGLTATTQLAKVRLLTPRDVAGAHQPKSTSWTLFLGPGTTFSSGLTQGRLGIDFLEGNIFHYGPAN